MKQLILASLLAFAPSFAFAQEAAAPAAADASSAAATDAEGPSAEITALVKSLNFKSGEVAVPQADARFKLGPGFRYLEQADARKVVEQLWGNPPDSDVLGLVVPANVALTDEHSWGVVVTHVDEGHVSDEDAAKADYAQILKDMQDSTREGNAERKKAGYGGVDLIGWAEPPHYDSAAKKIYWAKELKFDDSESATINYDIRVLGRSGYLSLNAVASKDDLPAVRAGMQELLPMVDFDPGQRYADFNPSTDKVATYGVAALVAGGLAAKAGLFAKLGALLLAGKKLIGVLVIGLIAAARKLFGGSKAAA